MGNIIREVRDSVERGDTDTAAKVLFRELASEPELPPRVSLGPDSNHYIRQKLKQVEADITKYERLSDDKLRILSLVPWQWGRLKLVVYA